MRIFRGSRGPHRDCVLSSCRRHSRRFPRSAKERSFAKAANRNLSLFLRAAAAGGPAGASQPAPRVREGTLQQAVIRRAVAVATRSGAARVLAAQGPRAAIDQRAALGRKPKRRPRDVTASRVQPPSLHVVTHAPTSSPSSRLHHAAN
ncbi:hypothetical protein MTO96_013420 [Rhipicephalus appendiculatus]